MADNRKLAQGLMMMTPAMREDLAGREQDIQRGKTVELLRRAGKEMYENPAVNAAISLTPGAGDVQAGYEAWKSAREGDWTGAGLNAVGMLPFVPALAGTFVGKGAKTWDAIQAAEAAKRLEAGEDAAKVWQETKYGAAPWDKQMRSEFSDINAYSKPQSEWGWASREGMKPGRMETAMGPVSEFYAHPEMEKAYSGLIDFGDADKRLIMRVQPKQTLNASFGEGRITTGLEGDVVPSSSVLHELQHAIQDQEGWARGGSPKEFEKEIESAYDEISKVNDQMGAIVKSMDAAKAAGDTAKYDKYKQMYNEAMDYKLGELVPKAQQDPMEAYKSLAGEAEARLTQARASLTPEQQAAQYPYDPEYFLKTTGVPIDKLISRFDEIVLINKPEVKGMFK